MRARRYATLLTILLCVVFACSLEKGGAQSTDEEYRVKAAFIFHFAQLVDWPPETSTDPANSLFFCTIGEDPFQGALESTVAGKPVGDRILRIRHLKQEDDLQACQVRFSGQGAKQAHSDGTGDPTQCSNSDHRGKPRVSRRRRNDLLCARRQQCSIRNQSLCGCVRKTQDRVSLVDPGPNRHWRKPGEVRA